MLFKFSQALAKNNLDDNDMSRVASASTLSLSALASTVVVIVNLLLKWTIKYFVSLEGHDTKTDFERRVFTMLSMAYVLNTVVMVSFATFEPRAHTPNCADWPTHVCLALCQPMLLGALVSLKPFESQTHTT